MKLRSLPLAQQRLCHRSLLYTTSSYFCVIANNNRDSDAAPQPQPNRRVHHHSRAICSTPTTTTFIGSLGLCSGGSFGGQLSTLQQCVVVVGRRGISKAARRRNATRNAGVAFYPAYLTPPNDVSTTAGYLERIQTFDHYQILSTVSQVHDWATAALESFKLRTNDTANTTPLSSSNRSTLVTSISCDNWNHSTLLGMYVGWNHSSSFARKERATTHMLYLALPHQPVAVLHLSSPDLNIHTPASVPSSLRTLLEHPHILVSGNVGRVHRHLARLRRQLDIYVSARVELDQWARHVEQTRYPKMERRRNPHLPPPARDMPYLCRHYLQQEMDPTFGDNLVYSAAATTTTCDELPTTTIQYGALQAEQALLVAQALQQHEASHRRSSADDTTTTTELPAVSAKLSKQEQHEQSLYVGQRVLVYFDGKLPVAEGVIEFLGGRNWGVSQLWGPDLLVNRGKALVRIDTVLMDQAIPTFADTTWPLYYTAGQALPWDRKLRLSHVYWSHAPIVAAMTLKLHPLVQNPAVVVESAESH
jgi:hypothetical protein